MHSRVSAAQWGFSTHPLERPRERDDEDRLKLKAAEEDGGLGERDSPPGAALRR